MIGKQGEPEQILYGLDASSLSREEANDSAQVSAEQSLIAQVNMIDSFYRSILFGEPPVYADFEQGHLIVRIVEAALESRQSRTWVTV